MCETKCVSHSVSHTMYLTLNVSHNVSHMVSVCDVVGGGRDSTPSSSRTFLMCGGGWCVRSCVVGACWGQAFHTEFLSQMLVELLVAGNFTRPG